MEPFGAVEICETNVWIHVGLRLAQMRDKVVGRSDGTATLRAEDRFKVSWVVDVHYGLAPLVLLTNNRTICAVPIDVRFVQLVEIVPTNWKSHKQSV